MLDSWFLLPATEEVQASLKTCLSYRPAAQTVAPSQPVFLCEQEGQEESTLWLRLQAPEGIGVKRSFSSLNRG